jgi:hypothetical protein
MRYLAKDHESPAPAGFSLSASNAPQDDSRRLGPSDWSQIGPNSSEFVRPGVGFEKSSIRAGVVRRGRPDLMAVRLRDHHVRAVEEPITAAVASVVRMIWSMPGAWRLLVTARLRRS